LVVVEQVVDLTAAVVAAEVSEKIVALLHLTQVHL
jgi:predicted transcriptional regulator|tara:strand:+ start:72 stop:176 length:105 start_codon:yes stop_codon:yes gene_type:complete